MLANALLTFMEHIERFSDSWQDRLTEMPRSEALHRHALVWRVWFLAGWRGACIFSKLGFAGVQKLCVAAAAVWDLAQRKAAWGGTSALLAAGARCRFVPAGLLLGNHRNFCIL